MKAAQRLQKGFTIIELVTVIALLAITMVVMAPRFFPMAPFRARGYADEITGSLRYAQRIAIASSCNVLFTVTAAGYSAAQRQSHASCSSSSAWNREVLLPDGTELAGTTPNGVAVSPAVLEYDGAGRLVSAASSISVGTFTLAIDPVTGRVTVQ